MITSITQPYKDEVFYSWFGRYHSTSGNVNFLYTDFDLSNRKRRFRNIYFPSNLNFLCSQFPISFSVSSDTIINDNTCFPFFKPFLKTSVSNLVVEGMKDGITRPIESMLGLYPSDLFNDRTIKICSQCVKEDKKYYDEAYIHRLHQIPGFFICPHHNIPLEYIDLSNTEYINNYFVLDDIISRKIPFKIHDNIYNQLLRLQSDIIYLLNSNLNDYNIENVTNKYRQKLINTGYSGSSRLIKHKNLLDDFLSFYSEDFLNFLNSNIDTKEDWLYGISQNRTFNLHPLRHLLFIRFLFGELDYFINESEEFLPFGHGPWPCLNIASEHYKKDMITAYKLKKSSHECKKYGIFGCECGFTYTKIAPQQSPADRYTKKSVISWGEEWESKATNLIVSENHSIRELMSTLDCSYGKIISHSTKYKLLHHLNTNVKYRPIKDTLKYNKDLIEQHKKTIVQFISDHKDMSRKAIYKALHRECNTVLKNDKQWYDNIMPPKLFSRIGIEQVDWQKRDLELSVLVLAAITEIKENTNLKISKRTLANKIGSTCILKSTDLSKLPITKKVIEDSFETKDEYLRRKFDYTVKSSLKNGNILTVQQFMSKLNIRNEMAERLYDYVEELIKKYSSS